MVLKKFPKSFTLGEAALTSQAAVILLYSTLPHFYYSIEDPITETGESSTIIIQVNLNNRYKILKKSNNLCFITYLDGTLWSYGTCWVFIFVQHQRNFCLLLEFYHFIKYFLNPAACFSEEKSSFMGTKSVNRRYSNGRHHFYQE